MSDQQGLDRDEDLRTIRATYNEYRRGGRDRIWDLENRGYAAIVRDRNGALVQRIRAALPSAGGRVLDLGCGDGGLAATAHAVDLPLAQWIGVDLDPVSIGEARASFPWAQFLEGSADELPFEDRGFDVVVASMLFSSLPTWDFQQRVAHEIARVLGAGGTLVWYDLRRANPANAAVHPMTARRIAALFPTWDIDLAPLTLIPPLARRLGPATFVAYPLLHSLGILRSHLVGSLRPAADGRPTIGG